MSTKMFRRKAVKQVFSRLTLMSTLSAVLTLVSGSRPNELIPITTCALRLTECPMEQNIIDFRSDCMYNFSGCPEGTYYLCGTVGKYIVESCQPDLSCEPESSFQYVMNEDDHQVRLECLPCEYDRFEPEWTRSSLSSRVLGCTYQHRPPENLSAHLVPFKIGTKSSAARWICDHVNGFCNENGNMFCDDIPTHPCKCIKKSCPLGHLLRPDKLCVLCGTKLMPESDFSSFDPFRNLDSVGRTNVTTATVPIASSEKGSEDMRRPTMENAILSLIPIVSVACFVVAVFLFVCLIYKLKKRRAEAKASPQNRQPLLDGNRVAEEERGSGPRLYKTIMNVFYSHNEIRNVKKDDITVNVYNGGKCSPRKEYNDSSCQAEEQTDSQPPHLKMEDLKPSPTVKDVEETTRKFHNQHRN